MNSEIKLSRIPGHSTDDEHSAGQIKQDRIFYRQEKFPDRSVLDPIEAQVASVKRAACINDSCSLNRNCTRLRFRINAQLIYNIDEAISRVQVLDI
jgi:hypothetical protein